MKQQIFLVIIFLVSWQMYSQKFIQKQIDGSEISSVIISGNTLFKIHISSHKSTKIDAVLKIEGENSEQVLLKAYTTKDTLFIGSSYQPMFIPPDDKSSAHKQISIELTLIIPEYLNLNVTSDIASVFIKGNFKNVVAELLNGNFIAEEFLSNLLVNTLRGDILVETNNAFLDLHTKKGTIHQEKLDEGKNKISLNSINGNISVTKTQ